MHSAFQHNRYLLRREFFSIPKKFRVYGPDGQVVLFSEQKLFKLKEDIRIYSDDSKSQELLAIKARNVLDFSAAYDILDATTQTHVGVLRRKGLRSMFQDQWEILSPDDQLQGAIQEDSLGNALLRRFLLGCFFPQHYEVTLGTETVAKFDQRFHLLRYELEIDFSPDNGNKLDHRLGLAAAILMGAIEGRQESS